MKKAKQYNLPEDLKLGAQIALEKIGQDDGHMPEGHRAIARFQDELLRKDLIEIRRGYAVLTEKGKKQVYPNRYAKAAARVAVAKQVAARYLQARLHSARVYDDTDEALKDFFLDQGVQPRSSGMSYGEVEIRNLSARDWDKLVKKIKRNAAGMRTNTRRDGAPEVTFRLTDVEINDGYDSMYQDIDVRMVYDPEEETAFYNSI